MVFSSKLTFLNKTSPTTLHNLVRYSHQNRDLKKNLSYNFT
jgi:hypothetical protein